MKMEILFVNCFHEKKLSFFETGIHGHLGEAGCSVSIIIKTQLLPVTQCISLFEMCTTLTTVPAISNIIVEAHAILASTVDVHIYSLLCISYFGKLFH